MALQMVRLFRRGLYGNQEFRDKLQANHLNPEAYQSTHTKRASYLTTPKIFPPSNWSRPLQSK